MVVGTGLGDGSRQVVAQGSVDGSAGCGAARGDRQTERDHLDSAAQVPGRRQAQAPLEAGEGDGAVGSEDGTVDGAVVDTGSAGQIDGDDT